MKEVSTKQASISTLSVTIKAIHVNNKQMTLAVFRQLPVLANVADYKGILEGLNAWGFVRYPQEQEWLVVDYKGKLYRHLFTDRLQSWKSEAAKATRRLEAMTMGWNDRHKNKAIVVDLGASDRFTFELNDVGLTDFLEEKEFRSRVRDFACSNHAAYYSFRDLPQLFIAV